MNFFYDLFRCVDKIFNLVDLNFISNGGCYFKQVLVDFTNADFQTLKWWYIPIKFVLNT